MRLCTSGNINSLAQCKQKKIRSLQMERDTEQRKLSSALACFVCWWNIIEFINKKGNTEFYETKNVY